MPQNTFERIEIKYLLSAWQYEEMRKRLSAYMDEDEYGWSEIKSLYYDTCDYKIIRASIEKPVYKEKLRLRAYGCELSDESKVFLELKKKYKGIVYKRRICLSYKEAMDYLNKGIYPAKDSQILREIDYFIQLYKPNRSTFIGYDRVALKGREDSNIRITFDRDIVAKLGARDFTMDGAATDALLKPGESLMEIKVSEAMPLWLTDILSELEIYPTSFSKYGKAYLNMIKEKRIAKEV
ncbi:MAG: polyphosphate polymerase domain-containing protein [Lachnospiraceae bacterium]|nr:polyphosphate polymerase domain-containing protein [Lachnospiraceae bacterium]